MKMLYLIVWWSLILGIYYFQNKGVLCCFYRNHYHDAMCDNHSCVISPPLLGGLPPTIFCMDPSQGCLPPMDLQYYWLEGFKTNCDECS